MENTMIFWFPFLAGMFNGMLIALLTGRRVPFWQRVLISTVVTFVALAAMSYVR